MLKALGYTLLAVIGLIVLVFILEAAGLGMFKFFAPKKEAIKREVYENTPSFVEGKLQDLSRYYREYQQDSTATGREAIRHTVQTQFSYFDADNVKDYTLKQFLINMRGF